MPTSTADDPTTFTTASVLFGSSSAGMHASTIEIAVTTNPVAASAMATGFPPGTRMTPGPAGSRCSTIIAANMNRNGMKYAMIPIDDERVVRAVHRRAGLAEEHEQARDAPPAPAGRRTASATSGADRRTPSAGSDRSRRRTAAARSPRTSRPRRRARSASRAPRRSARSSRARPSPSSPGSPA